MQTVQLNIQLDINQDILDKVMFILDNLPKNKVKLKVINSNTYSPSTKSFNPRDFFGVADFSKSEIDDYIKESRNEWNGYIDEK